MEAATTSSITAGACRSLSMLTSCYAADLLSCRRHMTFIAFRLLNINVMVCYHTPVSGRNERYKLSRSLSQDGCGTRSFRSTSSSDGALQEYEGGETKISENQVVELHVTPGIPPEPSRLDAYLTANAPEVSRARIVTSIKAGLVSINGKVMKKPAQKISSGDHVRCRILPPPSLEALPEEIPLDVHYEDDHLIVINKPAHMVRTTIPNLPRTAAISRRSTLGNALMC